MRGAVLRHHPANLARLPLLVAHAALCLAAAPHPARHQAIRVTDRTCAARPNTAASGSADRACSADEMAPIERQPGEWESPITSQLITSAVGEHACMPASCTAVTAAQQGRPSMQLYRCIGKLAHVLPFASCQNCQSLLHAPQAAMGVNDACGSLCEQLQRVVQTVLCAAHSIRIALFSPPFWSMPTNSTLAAAGLNRDCCAPFSSVQTKRLGAVSFAANGDLLWLEGRPAEKGRQVLVRRCASCRFRT